jgi:hypothetical protein
MSIYPEWKKRKTVELLDWVKKDLLRLQDLADKGGSNMRSDMLTVVSTDHDIINEVIRREQWTIGMGD